MVMPNQDIHQRQRLGLEERQEQTMTHQQIQSLELLSVPVLELERMVNEELANNPVLDPEEADANELPGNADDDEWLELILKLDESSRFLRSQRQYGPSREDEERRQHYLRSVTREPSLHDILQDQLRFIECDDGFRECCEIVIAGLDDDGYLKSHEADLAMISSASAERIREAIAVIQSFEPAGVAARDLRERLLLQLQRQDRQESLAYKVVSEHLDAIAANHLPQVARRLRISIEQLNEIIQEIHALRPHLQYGVVSPHEYVQEEVTVEEEEGHLVVHMNNDYLPPLRISKHYRQLLGSPDVALETREYVKEKIRSGVNLINSIIQRQTTIRKICDAIVRHQEDFFLLGTRFMKPLTMVQVAEMVGVHETTVSRAVAGKYLRSKHGLIPLRDFFTAGYQDRDGNEVSNAAVKQSIRQMLRHEDPQSPLSDQDIASQLKRDGLSIARRTVAKYRESLGILPSHLRRKF